MNTYQARKEYLNSANLPYVSMCDNGSIDSQWLKTHLLPGDILCLNIWKTRNWDFTCITKVVDAMKNGVEFKGYGETSGEVWDMGDWRSKRFLSLELVNGHTLSTQYCLPTYIWKVVRNGKVIQLSGGRDYYLNRLIRDGILYFNRQINWRDGEYTDKLIDKDKRENNLEKLCSELTKMGMTYEIDGNYVKNKFLKITNFDGNMVGGPIYTPEVKVEPQKRTVREITGVINCFCDNGLDERLSNPHLYE